MFRSLPSLLILFLFGCFNNSTQPNQPAIHSGCQEVKQSDSLELIGFSKQLNSLARNGDPKELAKVFRFPFPYTSCNLADNGNDKFTRLITREEFIENRMLDFGVWFKETLTKGYFYHILNTVMLNGRCRLVFDYPLALKSGKAACKRLFVEVEKIEGAYRISSAWQGE